MATNKKSGRAPAAAGGYGQLVAGRAASTSRQIAPVVGKLTPDRAEALRAALREAYVEHRKRVDRAWNDKQRALGEIPDTWGDGQFELFIAGRLKELDWFLSDASFDPVLVAFDGTPDFADKLLGVLFVLNHIEGGWASGNFYKIMPQEVFQQDETKERERKQLLELLRKAKPLAGMVVSRHLDSIIQHVESDAWASTGTLHLWPSQAFERSFLGKRGGARKSPRAAWRGVLARTMDAMLPSNFGNRSSTIAKLLKRAGDASLTLQNVRAVLKK